MPRLNALRVGMNFFSGRVVVALSIAGIAMHLYSQGFGLGEVWYIRVGDVRAAAVVLVSFAYVAVYAFRCLKFRQRVRWWEDGRCPNCGDDLRHSDFQCPECGERFA